MSATVDSSLFSNYFSILINGKKEGAPVISVEGKMYDVMEYYNDDVLSFAEVTKIIFAQKTHLQKRFNWKILSPKLFFIYKIIYLTMKLVEAVVSLVTFGFTIYYFLMGNALWVCKTWVPFHSKILKRLNPRLVSQVYKKYINNPSTLVSSFSCLIQILRTHISNCVNHVQFKVLFLS